MDRLFHALADSTRRDILRRCAGGEPSVSRLADVYPMSFAAVVAHALAAVGEGPVFLTVDVDVLDPAFAPGTGTPEPGGMTSADLLWACREVASHVALVGAEVVEVIPDRIGSRDITALVAERIVREILTGVAVQALARETEIANGRPSIVAASPAAPS